MTARLPQNPPLCPQKNWSQTHHGITRNDPYHWLKDEKWQEVMRKPEVLDPDIRKYLEAENG